MLSLLGKVIVRKYAFSRIAVVVGMLSVVVVVEVSSDRQLSCCYSICYLITV